MKTVLNHVAVNVKDFNWYKDFFENVCNMDRYREDGEAPHRRVWYREGIQLNEVVVEESSKGIFDHFCLDNEEVDNFVKKAIEAGCYPVEGKPHWFALPNGVEVEVKHYPVPTISQELLDKLREYSTPELCDGIGFFDTMDASIRPMVTTKKIVGPAYPIKVPACESSIVADAIKTVKKGDVIVVAGKGNCQTSYWGDHRSVCALYAGVEGVVIDGAFRDIDDCEEVGLPIYAKGVTSGAAAKSGVGEINVTVSCGGVVVHPGDIIVGDRNGIVVLPPDEKKIREIMAKADRKNEAQKWTIDEMFRTGEIMPKVIYQK